MSLVWTYALLAAAILAEVIATSALKASDGFTKLWPSVLVVVGYTLAFVMLAQVLKVVPTGLAYAIWSGGGIVLVSLFAWVWFGQTLDLPAIAGVAMILGGVLVITLLSKSVAH